MKQIQSVRLKLTIGAVRPQLGEFDMTKPLEKFRIKAMKQTKIASFFNKTTQNYFFDFKHFLKTCTRKLGRKILLLWTSIVY